MLLVNDHVLFRKPENLVRQPEAIKELTPREKALEQGVKDATNNEIATTLSITENTVKIHLRNILEKLHLQNRIQAAVYAVRQRLVDESSQAP